MNKVTVKTTGDFQLQDPQQLDKLIPVGEESEELIKTPFIEERVRLGQLEIVSESESNEPSTEVTLPASKRGEWPEGSASADRDEVARLAASDRDMAEEAKAMTSPEPKAEKAKTADRKPAEGAGGAARVEGGRTAGRTKSDNA
jgi:hypothetical protein